HGAAPAPRRPDFPSPNTLTKAPENSPHPPAQVACIAAATVPTAAPAPSAAPQTPPVAAPLHSPIPAHHLLTNSRRLRPIILLHQHANLSLQIGCRAHALGRLKRRNGTTDKHR